MKKILFLKLLLLLFSCSKAKEIRVLTDRTASHLSGVFNEYEHRTGVKIIPNYVDKAFLTRLTERPEEADVVITKNAFTLEIAKKRGVLAPFKSSKILKMVPAEFRDHENFYFSTTYRSRVIFYSKDRVKSSELNSYLDLAAPRYKGKVCIRSGYHGYNLSLFAQIAEVYGLETVEKFLKGLKNNLARNPKGNDRAQVRAVMEGRCDLAVANSYYMGIMLGRDDQKAWANATKVFFPEQKAKGSLVLRSGTALTKSKMHVDESTRFLEFLADNFAQEFFANTMFAYPVKNAVAMAPVNQILGKEQGVLDGKFKKNVISLSKVVDLREKIVAILDKLEFDK
jgi:iron(III) transport system substrate-binding protein